MSNKKDTTKRNMTEDSGEPLLSVSSFAKKVNKSNQAIYQALDNKLSTYLVIKNGKKYIKASGLAVYGVVKQEVNNLSSNSQEVDKCLDIFKEQLKEKDKQIEALMKQLEAKDRQIDDYSKRLQEAHFSLVDKNKVKLLGVKEEQKTSLFDRLILWKNKKERN